MSSLRAGWIFFVVVLAYLERSAIGVLAPTITKDCGNTSTGMIHPHETRKLTIPEIKRLSSFPDDFKTFGSFHDQWARIGNAVMPRFMYHIAKNIRENILHV